MFSKNKHSVFMLSLILIFITVFVNGHKQCYWNSQSAYPYFSSKTPYDTVRGDIRDFMDPPNCKAISLWTLIRHGFRNPESSTVHSIKHLVRKIKHEIIESYNNGNSQLCGQDIENIRKWYLSRKVKYHPCDLTSVGYEELYGIGKRIREKYPHLLTSRHDVYIRGTKEARTKDSARAFVKGISAHTGINLKRHRSRYGVAAPYQGCKRFHKNLHKNGVFQIEGEKFYKTEQALAVKRAVQQRLGIATKLSDKNIWTLYDICRFDRYWAANFKSPWCALFSNDDLKILEYRDDMQRYHRNGYGVWFNPNLGAQPLKDMYERFEAAIKGKGKKIVAYMGHATMLEMMYTALDMFKDAEPLTGSRILHERLWRNSFNNPMANNLIAVLYKCDDSDSQHKIQMLHNEKLSGICPVSGCTWDQFTEKFSRFLNISLDFCNMDYSDS